MNNHDLLRSLITILYETIAHKEERSVKSPWGLSIYDATVSGVLKDFVKTVQYKLRY